MTWAELPPKLKIYIFCLTIISIPIAVWAGWDLLHNHYNNGWIVLTALTLLTVPFFLFLPSVSATIGISDAYIMAIGMIYGVPPCIAATFFYTVFASLLAKRPKIYAYRVIFNTSSMIFGAWVYSNIYRLISNGSIQMQSTILPAVALTLTYFIINSTLTSIAISWSVGGKIKDFWLNTCMPLAVDFSVSSAIAIFIVALNSWHEYAPLAAAPFLGVGWGWNKVNKARAMELQEHLSEQEQLYLRTVESLALAVDAKDQTTYGHIRRVGVYALGLAKLCGIQDPSELMAIKTGSLLHDIGKLAIDDYILNKPGRLTEQEFEKMKLHAAAGDEILQQIRFPFPVAKYVRYHHEQWNGQGYPDGLKEEEIPLGARILAIADSFDAMHYSRPYKLSYSIQESVNLLRSQAGKLYDPNLVQLFIDHIDELEKAAESESRKVPELSFRKYSEKTEKTLSAANVSMRVPILPHDLSTELIQLSEFCKTIGEYLEVSDLLPIICRRIERLVPFTTCVFYLDSGENFIKAAYASGSLSESIKNHTIGLGKGISGWVAAYKHLMINTNPALDFYDVKGDFSVFIDTLAVPILFETESLGTITLYAQAPIRYTQQHATILQTLATILAPLLSNAQKNKSSLDDNPIDPITQTYRVACLSVIGPQMIAFAENNNSPLSLVCLEIKNLSQITRLYGSNASNSLLRSIADCIRSELRETDIVTRYGHQGFIVLLPGVREEQALHCAQRLQGLIRNKVLSSVVGRNFVVDYRVGISSFPKDGSTVFALLESAQQSISAISSSTRPATANIIDFSSHS